MHRIYFPVLLILVSNVLVSVAQDTVPTTPKFPKAVFGFKAGMNISRFSASINSESRAKPGPVFGMYVRKQTGKKVFFRWELYYSNQGQKDNYVMPSGGGPAIGRTTTNMHYINVPVLWELGKVTTFQFGFQPGLLLAGKEKGTIESAKVNNKLNKVMTTGDIAVVGGIGYSPGQHFNCGARVNFGVNNIYKADADYGTESISLYNRVLHFYIGYSF
jgi:hypothetical protein